MLKTFKRFFVAGYWLVLVLVAGVALVNLFHDGTISWLGTLTAALAPLANRVFPFDVLEVPYHKVRRPRVSLCVLAGLAWVLLTVSGPGPDLWLVLLAVAGFLLSTYWAEDASPSRSS